MIKEENLNIKKSGSMRKFTAQIEKQYPIKLMCRIMQLAYHFFLHLKLSWLNLIKLRQVVKITETFLSKTKIFSSN